jgi:hypothetical protein
VVEHFLGKKEVIGSSPIVGSTFLDLAELGLEEQLGGKEFHGEAEV